MKKGAILILTICLTVLAVRLWPHDAQYYVDRGEKRLMDEDEDSSADVEGALADFNRALKLNPNLAVAYLSRGGTKEMLGDPDGALADYNRAIELDPKNADGYYHRAGFRQRHGDLDGAMADYDRAVAVNPLDERAYGGRAHIWHLRGSLVGTLTNLARINEVSPFPVPLDQLQKMHFASREDSARVLHRLLRQYDRAIAEDPDFYWGYYTRGVLKNLANDPDGALADLGRCREFPDSKLHDYAALHLWLVRTQMKESTEANRDLTAYLQTRTNGTPQDFELEIAKFLLDQSSEPEFSAAVAGPEAERQRSQFWFYAAMKQLLAGDKTKADDYFRRARVTETRPYAVAISSQIELSFLER